MNGILVVDKPIGWTSFDVIAKLRGALHTRKIGHSGTLDPLATGVLPLFVGTAVKAVDLPQNHKKSYEATLRFGVHTPTGDLESEPDEVRECTLERAALEAVLPGFLGTSMQLPPMYSAVKVNGQPLYKAARAGREVERQPREIEIDSITCTGPGAQPNEWRVAVSCSKGTYIRVLVEDIAAKLGTIAVMSALRRTASGDFTLAMAHPLQTILQAAEQGEAEGLLLGVDEVFGELTRLDADDVLYERLFHGAPTHLRRPDGLYRVYHDGVFLGLAEVQAGSIRVKKLFCER